MAPFEPAYRDGKSAAALITELASLKPYDHVLTYAEIAVHLGISDDEEARIRSGIARAKPRLLREHQKALLAVPRAGYRIVRPGEQAALATSHRKKSDRSIKRAIAIVTHADENAMTEAERERNRKVGMVLSMLHERQVDVETRVARLESLMLGKHRPATIPGSVIPPLAIETGHDDGEPQASTAAA